MRLINADKLKEEIKEEGCDRFESWDKKLTLAEYETFIGDVIDNAPTVEQRPQGQWVIKKGEYSWWHICSNCKATPLTSGLTNQDVLSDFCPSCGADMREGTEE